MKRYLFLSIVLPFSMFASINGNGDWQVWQRVFSNSDLTEKLSLDVLGEVRWGDDCSKFYFTYLQALFHYHFTPWFSVAPGYRQIYKRSPLSSNHFLPEYSPMVDVFFRYIEEKWELSDRSRIQYLIFESDPSHWVYRNSLRFTFPVIWTRFTMRPYIEDELFFRERKGFIENRTVFAMRSALTSNIIFDVFYIARFLKRNVGWTYTNVVGGNLVFNW